MASPPSVLDSFLFPEITPTVTHARTSTVTASPIITRKDLLSSLSQRSDLLAPSPPTSRPPSFVEIVNKSQPVVHMNPNQDPTMIFEIGGEKAVRVSQSIYQERLALCKHSIVGRITLAKGENPWKHQELKIKLNKLWKLDNSWKLISLGRGFYLFVLPTAEIKKTIWGFGSINLRPGIMRFSAWTPGFDPRSHKTMTAQVWIRFYDLPWEFWDKRIIADIARAIGVPLRFDRNTVEGEFEHFARILVDLDLSTELQQSIRVDTANSRHWVTIEYENLPAFCDNCSSIGHQADSCRQNHERRNKGESNKGAPTEGKEGGLQDTRPPPEQMVAYQRGHNKEIVPVKKVFAKIIDGTTKKTPDSKAKIVETHGSESPRTDSHIAVHTAEEGTPPVNALAKDVTLSPYEGSASLVKETPLRQPWSSDSEDEPIRGFIPSDYYNSFSASNSWRNYDYDAHEDLGVMASSKKKWKHHR